MTRFHNREAQKIVASFLGSNTLSFRGIGIALILMVIASWLPDGFIEVISGVKEEDKLKVYLQLGIAIVLLTGLIAWIKNSAKYYIPSVDIDIDISPQASKVLILFLSSNPKAHDALLANDIDDLGYNNFRMPLLALDYHKSRLQKVLVLCSKDSPYAVFKQAVQKFLPELDSSKLEQVSDSLDFEDGNAVYEQLERLYQSLSLAKFKHKDIMLDITGGTKIVTLASAIFAIPNDKELEYVSTFDYQVKTYDIRYNETQ